MIHIIYIPIILFFAYHTIRAYHLYNKKHKELLRFKETNKVPYDLLSHYEKAYVNFYKWMTKYRIKKNIIRAYEKTFKYYDGSMPLEEIERINKLMQE